VSFGLLIFLHFWNLVVFVRFFLVFWGFAGIIDWAFILLIEGLWWF
jgi:hypothetical protein